MYFVQKTVELKFPARVIEWIRWGVGGGGVGGV